MKMTALNENLVEVIRDALSTGESKENLPRILEDLQPFDLANILPEFEKSEQLNLMSVLPAGKVADALEYLEPVQQYWFLFHLGEPFARKVLNGMSSDIIVDFFAAIHQRQADRLFQWLPEEYQTKVRSLMSYPENTAGGLAIVEYVSARKNWTAEQALAHVRKIGNEAEIVSYVYVLDAPGRLVGIVSLRELILAAPKMKLEEFMNRNVISLNAYTDQEEVARVFGQYDLVALPVVDKNSRMVGIVTVDDVLDVVEEEATEDIQLLGGSQPLDAPYMQASFFSLYRKRVGWLLILFIAQAFTSNILRHYEGVLSEVISLALFIPLLIGTGGNAGAQASTLVVRALAVGELNVGDFARVVWRESRLGILLGLTMAVATYIRAVTIGGSMDLGITVSATIVAIVTVSSTVGAAIPIVGRKVGVDPAVLSAPVITTIIDSAGLFIYFEFARRILLIGQ
ncbi:MAG: magnesium transporter [Peptococcaceae bacterium]|nr:magnesium transporter [Candidatus Syntrophopropionicum ammoniitolerans]